MKLNRTLTLVAVGVAVLGITALSPAQSRQTQSPSKIATDVSQLIRQAGAAINSFLPAIADRLRILPGGTSINIDSECPKLTLSQRGRNMRIGLDYGKGCRAPVTANREFAGRVALEYELLSPEVKVQLSNFSVDNSPIQGTLGLGLFPKGQPANTVRLRLDLRSGDMRIVGPVFVRLSRNGSLLLNDGEYRPTIYQGNTRYPISFQDVRMDPIRQRSFLPIEGQVTVQDRVGVPQDSPLYEGITVRFLPNTPSDREVDLVVGRDRPSRLPLPF
ncbi:MAG: hypothetical protein ACK4P3_04495 [Fimbriimonadaceae bacterium]